MRITVLWVVILVASATGAWYFGRSPDGATDLSKKVSPFAAADVRRVTFTIGGRDAAFARGDDGKFAREGALPAPVPASTLPSGAATPAVPTVAIPPGSRVESFANQLHDLPVDRTLPPGSGDDAQFGLDRPSLVVVLHASAGGQASMSFGSKDVGDSRYYVRREARGVSDVILVSKYSIDDLIKFATEVVAAP